MQQQIRPRDLVKLIENGHDVYLLDVRQSEEHRFAALPGCTLIPLNELPGRVLELSMPKESLVVVYCHHGMRSLTGAGILQKAGFTNVASLAGGIDAWSREVDPDVPRY